MTDDKKAVPLKLAEGTADDFFPVNESEIETRENEEISAQISGNATDNADTLSFDERVQKAVAFLQTYFKDCHGYAYIWVLNKQLNRKSTFYFNVESVSELTDAVKHGMTMNQKDCFDTYFGVNVGSCVKSEHERHIEKDIAEQVAVVADIDIRNNAHHKGDAEKYPPNIDTAKNFLPIKPTFLISSGGGLHAYYRYQAPLVLDSEEERKATVSRNKSFLDVLKQRAGVFAKSIDGVHDLPRVLRLPYSYNCKDRENLKLCYVIDDTGDFVTPAQIDEIISASKAEKQTLNFSDNSKVDADVSVKSVKPVTLSENVQSVSTDEDLPPEYESARVLAMLDSIPPSALSDTDWLAVISACKNLGVDESVIDRWNMQDAARYNEQENKSRYDSLKESSFDIETLAGKARDFGYSERDFRRQWFKDNPSYSNNLICVNTAADIPKHLRLTAEQREFLFRGDTSDLDFARRIWYVNEGRIRYLQDVDKFITFDGVKWDISRNVGNGILFPIVTELADSLSANAKNKHEKVIADAFKSGKKFSASITCIKGVRPAIITADDLNKNPNLINCLNGVVDLETGRIYPHSANFLMTQCINAEYRAGYRNETVESFLNQIITDEETLAAILRYLGYCLTGEVNAEKALLFYGKGGNGKGTLTGTLIKLFGTYATPFPVKTLLSKYQSKDADAATPAFSKLQWKRLAISEEIPQSEKLDAATFKLLTGGDYIPIRKLHEEASEISPTHKLLISGNYNVELDSNDVGLRRRIMRVEFNQYFTGTNQDTTLKKKLVTADALSGLLTLLVDSAIAYYRAGLIESAEMQTAKEELFTENDYIGSFIEENCVIVPNKFVYATELLKRLRDFAASETKALSDTALRKQVISVLEEKGIKYERKKRGNAFCGLDWAENQSDYQTADEYETPEDF